MLKVIHIIVGLEAGGAETMMRRLVEASRPELESTVVSLTGCGPVGEALRSQGVHVEALGLRFAWQLPVVLVRLVRLLRRLRPDAVQTWMYHADFLGGIASRLAGCRNVAWGIHSTSIPQKFPAPTWWLVRLNAVLSHFVPHRIVCCAESARQAHTALGFDPGKMVVIPNGLDFSAFVPSAGVREHVRREQGWDADTLVIGLVGRFDPLKDIPNFLAAAGRVSTRLPAVRYLLVGRGLDERNEALCRQISVLGLGQALRLAGEQRDVPSFLAAMDIFCLSSRSEAFPNVVVEAMAMHRPCVATAVGDVASIVGDAGRVVAARDAAALGDALTELALMPREQRDEMGRAAGRRVRERYSLDLIVRRYIDEYRHPAARP